MIEYQIGEGSSKVCECARFSQSSEIAFLSNLKW